MITPGVKQVARIIEGVIALCLGSAERVVWVDQSDAAAFNDGQRLFLPTPVGGDEREFKLLMAIALREVAKLQDCDSHALVSANVKAHAFAVAMEEARLKRVLSKEYRGAPSIFDEANTLAGEILLNEIPEDLTLEQAAAMVTWGQAHNAFLQTTSSQEAAASLRAVAEKVIDSQMLESVMAIAHQGPACQSTTEVIGLAQAILSAIARPPMDSAEQQQDQGEPQSQDGAEPGDNGGADPAPPPDGRDTTGPEDSSGDDASQEGDGGAEQQQDQGNARSQDGAQPGDSGNADAASPPDGRDTTGQKESSGSDAASQEGDGGAEQQQGQGNAQSQDGAQPGDSGSADAAPPSDSRDTAAQGESSGGDGAAQHGDDASQDGGSGARDASGESQSDSAASADGGETGSTQGAAGNAQRGARDGDGAGQECNAPANAVANDMLSQALARNRGHATARDVSSQAQELAQAAQEAAVDSAAPPALDLDAIAEALNQDEGASEALVQKATEIPEGGEVAEDGSGEALPAMVSPGGDGYAAQRNADAQMHLPQVQARLVTVLLREIQDKRRRPFLRSAGGSRLATTQLWRMKAMGDTRVFRKKAPTTGIDAAVSILLDTSGSMESQLGTAVEVTYALAQAHHRICGTQVSIDIFPGMGVPAEEILAFKQNLRQAEDTLKAVQAGGGTPTGPALAIRLPKLLSTRAEKRVIWLITDGQPHDRVAAWQMVQAAEEAGVEVYGIGIGTDISHLIAKSVYVESVEKLADAVETLFKSEVAQRLAA